MVHKAHAWRQYSSFDGCKIRESRKMKQQQVFSIRAVRDEQTGVFYSQSDITGFHIEAETLDEFRQLVKENAGDMVKANHKDVVNPVITLQYQ